MKIAAIILNYFGEQKTRKCLISLQKQGLTTVLVLDNSADLNAFKLLEETTADLIEQSDFRLILQPNTTNVGFGKGMNQALRWFETHSPHDFYLLINNDAEADLQMVNNLIDWLNTHPKTMMVSPQILSNHQLFPCFYYHISTGLLFRNKIRGSFLYLSGCCLLLRKEIVTFPFFDETFFMYGEDTELSWRLQKQGHIIENVMNATVIHEGVGSSTKGGEFYEYQMVTAHLLLAHKLADNYLNSFIFFGLRSIILTIRAFLRAFRYRSLVPFKMLLKAWKNYISTIN
jgi:GT2 family glycosyltransferase